jgi:hypothetical protein
MALTTPAMLAIPHDTLSRLSPLDALATLPEEEVWLASRKSPDTRRVYAQDVHHFLRALGITSRDELRRVDRKAVIAWERSMRAVQRLHPAAGSSLTGRPRFDHHPRAAGPSDALHGSTSRLTPLRNHSAESPRSADHAQL